MLYQVSLREGRPGFGETWIWGYLYCYGLRKEGRRAERGCRKVLLGGLASVNTPNDLQIAQLLYGSLLRENHVLESRIWKVIERFIE